MLWKKKDWEDECRNKRIGVNIASMGDRKINQRLSAEQMWVALLDELYEGKVVSMFKGGISSCSFSDEETSV